MQRFVKQNTHRTGCWHFNDDLSAVRPSPAAAFFSDGDQNTGTFTTVFASERRTSLSNDGESLDRSANSRATILQGIVDRQSARHQASASLKPVLQISLVRVAAG
jgi:hypothetical protein